MAGAWAAGGLSLSVLVMGMGMGMGVACTVEPSDPNPIVPPPPTSFGSDGPTDDDESTAATSTTTEGVDDTFDDGKLDTPPPMLGGCQYIDFLFVIDNSESMQTFQMALTEQFPDFVTAMYDALPPNIDVHVGLTTTDFDDGCDAQEATMNCQSTATLPEVQAHYLRPDETNDGGNGTQGRLFEFGGRTYFETNSNDDPGQLSTWFSQAAVAAGEDGCSFEMPVAATGFFAHPANATANEGFLRDANALLVIFYLTDEPDKSVESKDLYAQMVRDAKAECGGDACIFVSGLVPPCIVDVNQKLWQFMNLFDEDEPIWGDIELTGGYANVFGDALAGAIAEACANVPVG
ncbi:hypothetical protein [Paraliomyxa miuraensis]|uniref:hypothetical protein n=1 Tax=Paraliomyxa miuraensis TaxID=376150 RepID=UPI002253B9E7|nr:hypothetical protein [Paraliomyxa miuraensis]MCX4239385.1 hypothetical protein [Paraliomyxa miuraensis]